MRWLYLLTNDIENYLKKAKETHEPPLYALENIERWIGQLANIQREIDSAEKSLGMRFGNPKQLHYDMRNSLISRQKEYRKLSAQVEKLAVKVHSLLIENAKYSAIQFLPPSDHSPSDNGLHASTLQNARSGLPVEDKKRKEDPRVHLLNALARFMKEHMKLKKDFTKVNYQVLKNSHSTKNQLGPQNCEDYSELIAILDASGTTREVLENAINEELKLLPAKTQPMFTAKSNNAWRPSGGLDSPVPIAVSLPLYFKFVILTIALLHHLKNSKIR